MSDRLEVHLKERIEAQGKNCEWVFLGRTKAGHRRNLEKQWLRAVRKANEETELKNTPGIPEGLVFYCSRHTSLTNLNSETGDLALVQRIAGHESITTTQRYLHPSIAEVSKLVNQINKKKTGLHLIKSESA